MPTLNINGNIRTNTAAGWAADATVYSAKTILVTTDATYGATDQRKFKIADGTQTWSNLDYFPVSGYDDATSSIQTQLDNKVCAITFFQTSNQSIADSTSYFIASVTSPATTLANSSMIPVKAGTLIGVSLGGFNASTVGSNEAWTVKLWYNNGLNSVTLTTNFTGGNANRNYFLDVDGLSTAIDDGNCAVEFAAPALATNPTGFRPTATIYIKR